jgi:trans-aconitate 2-methyltransferase
MVEHARAALGDEATFLTSDLVELTPEVLKAEAGATAVDVIFSNATFHWIPDHEALFRRLHDLLVPGGRLVAQCAAEGNVPEYNAAIRDAGREAPFAPHLAGWDGPFNFASAADTEPRLRAAGFDPVACEVIRFDTTLDDPRGFIMASGLAPHFERLPEELHEPFADAVLSRLGDPVILHYVRLNIDARRPA